MTTSELLATYGARVLTDIDILTMTLGSLAQHGRIAHKLIKRFGNLAGVRAATSAQLVELRMTPNMIERLNALSEVAIRMTENTKKELRPSIDRPEDVFHAVRKLLAFRDKETFLALYLNARNQIITISAIGTGTADACLVSSREIFHGAIATKACAIILVHNHPSCKTDPSQDDITLTDRAIKSGKIIGIQILDSVVVSDHEWTSIKEEKPYLWT